MTSSLLMYAVFALDSYNEDPNTAQLYVSLNNNQLGDATLLNNTELGFLPLGSAGDGFYATSYELAGGQIVISYRGTLTQIIGTEIANGYGVGAGIPFVSQGTDAIQYFHNVAVYEDPSLGPNGGDPGDWQSANIAVTGHSLGGGLAGFVGALYGLTGVLFDNMTFNTAADNAYAAARYSTFVYGSSAPYAPYFQNLSAYATSGELLETALPKRASQTPRVNYLEPYAPTLSDPVNLHSQALLTLLIYAQGKSTAWQSIGPALYNAYFNNALGVAVGFKQGNIGVPGATGQGTEASQMLGAIAYSVLDSGGMPFGDTAVVSLFADANTLGGIQSAGKFAGFLLPSTKASSSSKAASINPVGALTEIAVQFAADQARAVTTDQTFDQGAFNLTGSVLTADLNPGKWTSTFAAKATTTTTYIVGVGDFFNTVLTDVAAGISPGDPTFAWAVSNAAGLSSSMLTQLNEITKIYVALGSGNLSAAGTLPAAYDGKPGGAMLVGSIGQGAITGTTNGNDIIVGGRTITAGNGNDIIVAPGAETVTVGTGKNLILAGSPSMNVTMTYAGGAIGASGGGAAGGQSGGPPPATASIGTDVIIGNSAGGDTFTFTDAERAAFTVVWGGSGDDTFNIDTSSSSNVNVVELDLSGISGGNLANLDATKLENYVDQTYGLTSSQATLVILNPSTSDKLSYNGKAVTTPTPTLSSTGWENDYSNAGQVTWVYQNAPPVDWSDKYSASFSDYTLASANFEFNFILGNGSTREVSLDPVVQKATTTGGVSVTTGALGSYDRDADSETTFFSSTSAATLNLINYNPGDFGIGLPENGSALDSIQKETEYDQYGALFSNTTKQSLPISFYDPSFADPSDNRPTENITQFLSGTSSSDPTGVSTAFFSANQALLDGQFYGFTILDTAANVSSALDALNDDSKLTGITLTDSGTPTLTLTISQASNDTTALGEITNASYDIAIADTAANVSQAIDALNSDATVTSIHLTDAGTPSLTLTAMQALQDTTALSKISNATYTIAISDTAADLAFDIDVLNGDAAVSSITLTDSGALTLTVAQTLADATALGKITNAAYDITVDDTAANILANASALSGDVHVTGAIVVDTVANVLDNAAALNANAQVTSVTVVDTAANILANLSALQADAKVTSIIVTDTAANVLANATTLAGISEIKGVGVVDSAAEVASDFDALDADTAIGWVEFTDSGTATLTLTAAQVVNDSGLLAKIASPYAIDVVDTAAAIAENIDALAKIATLASVTLTDAGTPVLTLTAAQAVNDVGVIGMISNTNAQIVVSDTAANVIGQLDALNADSKITSITLTDAGTPTLTLTVAQLLGDATVLGKIRNANLSIVASDTAANVSANFDALNADGTLSSITLSDSGTPTLSLTAAQAVGDAGLLAKISNTNYTIAIFDSVSNILVDAGSLVSDGKVSSITAIDTVANILGNSAALVSAGCTTELVSDTAANVAANFEAIKADTSIQAISLTDSGTPTLSLTVAQTIDDAAVLAMIANSTFAIDVSGTAADIAENINDLAANNLIGAVTLTDAGVPTLSLNAGEGAGDGAFLSKITNANYVIDVADTAAEVSANLDALNANAKIGAIALTDLSTPVLNLSVTQALDDTTALGLITSTNYTIAVTGTAANVVTNAGSLAGNPHVSSISVVDNAANVLAAAPSLAGNSLLASITVIDTAANVVANESALAAISTVTAIDVVDTAAAVSANFDALKVDNSISEITLSDANPVLTLTAEQAANDYSAFNKITNSSYSIAVVDTAADVSQYLGQLAYSQNLTSITLTDSGTPTLDLYSYELGSGVLSKVTNTDYAANVLDSSAVTVSTFVADQAVLDASPGGFSISDTAADVSTEIDALSADTHLTSITLTDSGTPNLALSAAQFVNDVQALGKITNSSYTISITDTAANILDGNETFAANSHITSLVVQDSAANVLANATALNADSGITSIVIVDTAANVLANQSALGALTAPVAIKVADSAADVSASIDQLNADASLSSITLTDAANPTLTLTVGQAIDDSTALSKIAGPSPYVSATYGIAIVDTAANVSANIDALRNITQISSISLTDSQQLSLTLDAIDALGDQGVLGTLSNATYSVAVVDTAANIETDIDGLSFDPNISSITVQDADVINVTAAQAAQDAAVLGKIANATVNVVNTANISVAEFLSEQSALDSIPANFSILDTAANVSIALTALNADPNLSAITLSDSGVPTLTLTATQALQSTVALGEITDPSYAIAISDTAANVAAQFDALNRDGNVASITLTDSGEPTLVLTASQFENDKNALDKISNAAYVLSIVGTGSENINIGQPLQLANLAYDAANGDWQVNGSSLADRLTSVASVVDGNGQRYLLVGGGSEYTTADAAVAAASNGDIILLTPGSDAGSVGINGKAITVEDVSAVGGAPNVPPTVTITSAAEASNVASQTITGTVVSGGAAIVGGQTVTLTDNGATLGTATVQSDGTFSANVTLPDQGSNSIAATVTDSLGNTGTSAAVVDTLDNVAPTVTITSTAEASNVASQTITGTVASGGAAVVVGQTVTLTDNGTTLGAATVQSDGTFSASVTLPNQGSNSIVATVTDSFGNIGNSAAVVDTLDNVAPNVTVTSAAEASNSPNQAITGTVASGGAATVVGQTVTMTDNGTTIGTATVQSDGTFSANVTLPNQGSNSIVVTVTDSFGNTGTSAAVVDTLDNVPPTVTITSSAEASKNAGQTVTGTVTSGGAAAVVGQTVTLADNGTTIGTATVQADGSFSANVTLPNQGSNSIVATVTDSFGNTGTSTAVVDTLDNVAPSVTITSAAEGSNVATQTIAGTVASGGAATVVGQTVTLTDNGTTVGTATVQADGTFSASVTLPNQGSNSIVATVTDSFGNTGESAAVVDTLDNVVPTVTITSAAEASNLVTQAITGTVTSGGAATVVGQTVTLADNGMTIGTATVQADGSFSANVTLPNQGSNSIVASVTDSFGNTGTSTAVVDTLDNVAPTVTITSAAEASNVPTQTIAGTVASGGAATVVGQTVTLTDNGTTIGTATVQADGTFSASVTLPNQGSNSIIATLTDSFGNAGSSSAVVDTLDNLAPTVTVTSAAEAGNAAGQTITGTVASGGAAAVLGQTVTLTDNGTTLGTATVQSDGTFSASVTLPDQGSNSIVATVTDRFGNIGTSAAVVDTLDNVAPTVTITSAAEASNLANQTITGTVASGGAAAVVGQTVTLTDNGATIGTATVQSNGSFSASVTLPNQGSNSIVATVSDSFGNTGTSAAVVDTLDNVPPVVTITSAAEGSSNPGQTITGTVASGGVATVVGQTVTLTDNGTTLATATVQADGTFSANVTLPNQGSNFVVATVTDSFGNTGTSAVVVDTLDNVPPTVTITSVAEGSRNAGQTITGTVASGGAAVVVGQTVTLIDNGTTLGMAVVQSNGTFSANVTLPNQGSNSIVAKVTDSFGNTGTSTAIVDLLDNIPPTVTITSGLQVSTVANQTITGTVTSGGVATVVGQTVTLTDNGTTLATAVVQSNGTFSASVTLPNQGINSIVATVTDSYGNIGTSAAVISAWATTSSASNTTISLASSSAIIVTGTSDTVVVNAGLAELNDPSGSITVNGANDILLIVSSNSSGTLNGDSETVTLSGGSDTAMLNGTGDSVTGNNATINLSTTSSSASVTGNGDVVSVTTGDTVSISGTGDFVSGSGATVNVAAGSSLQFYGNNTVSANNAALYLRTAGEVLTLGGVGDTVTLYGLSDTVSLAGSGDMVTIMGTDPASSASGATTYPTTINATSDTVTIDVAANSSGSNYGLFTVNGSGNTVSLNNGAFDTTTLQLNGNSETATLSGSSDTATLNGTGDSVTGNNATINLSTTSSSASITGNGDIISVTSGDSLSLSGTGDAVYGGGASVTVASGSSVNFAGNNTVTANNATLGLNNGAFTVSGVGDTINLYSLLETLTLAGTGDSVTINTIDGSPNASAASSYPSTIDATSDTMVINVAANTSSEFGLDIINGSGNTITLNNGAFDSTTLQINGNNDTVSVGGNNNTVIASGSNETYLASATSGSVTIQNATAQGSAAQGQMDFASGITDENLWFTQSGSNLNIDILGTQDQFTIQNWFGSNPAAQFSEIGAGGLKLDSAVSQLVQAMATYSANNPGFSPSTATQMPADSNLQSAIAAAWH